MISFIIPALDEAEHIESTVDTIYAAVSAVELIDKFEIVIIDDGFPRYIITNKTMFEEWII